MFAIGTVVTVDRIEGPYAVLEWDEVHVTEVPIYALPPHVEEGDRLVLRAQTLPRPSVARPPGRRSRGAGSSRRERAEQRGARPRDPQGEVHVDPQ